tara:strand:+ start:1062 stop:2432 length:1371 start_codon:yes stop_codon:yes gene_type:complete
MYFVARLVGKIVAFLSPLLRRGGGTSAPGMALLRLHPNAFSKLSDSLDKGSVLISATNGKTTTTRFLSEILNDAGVACVSNTSGANLKSGVATALLTKERHHDLGVLEVDEAALPEIVKENRPRMLILMNLFRDQLDRYGELESIAKRWRKMIFELHPDTRLLVNADDPILADIGLQRPGSVFFGLGDASGYSRDQLQHASDSSNCPQCSAPLSYKHVTLSHMGDWKCENCNLTRPQLDFEVSQIRLYGLNRSEFTIYGKSGFHEISSTMPGLHNVYNALAAFSAASELGIDHGEIAASISQTVAAFGRTEKVIINDREIHILLAKNPAGANANIDTLLLHPGPLHLCVLLNDRVADGRDVSWIWDVDYERVLNRVKTLHVGGERSYDLALRFLYGGFEKELIQVTDSIPELLDSLVSSTPNDSKIFVLPSYTAMLDLRDHLVKRNATHAFWKDGK